MINLVIPYADKVILTSIFFLDIWVFNYRSNLTEE